MKREEWAEERKIAAADPVKYITDRGIFRLETLPESLRHGWCTFWLFGIWPGSFLSAVIRNDLIGAFSAADYINTLSMHSIVAWFYNYGDPRAMKDKADTWSKAGGYFGSVKPEGENG